jgi:hypothetical protein
VRSIKKHAAATNTFFRVFMSSEVMSGVETPGYTKQDGEAVILAVLIYNGFQKEVTSYTVKDEIFFMRRRTWWDPKG